MKRKLYNSKDSFLRNPLTQLLFSNYYVIVFILIIFLVSMVIVYKAVLARPEYIYAKVEVGQGYWWASTVKPNAWFVNAVKKGEKQMDILGREQAEVISATHYIASGTNNFDLFLVLKLEAGFNRKTGVYSFDRSPIAVGSPIEVQFPSADITGTVIEISKTPLEDAYITKKVELIYRGGYTQDFPELYDNIKPGEQYFDGENYVFKVLDKRLVSNVWGVSNILTGQVYDQAVDVNKNIVVDALVKVIKKQGQFIYGENQVMRVGNYVNFATQDFQFNNFLISKIY